MGTLLTVNHEGARYNGETVALDARTRWPEAARREVISCRPSTFVNVFAPDKVNKWLTGGIIGLIEA